MNGGLGGLGAGHLEAEPRQGWPRHQFRQLFRQRDAQWVLPLKTVALVRLCTASIISGWQLPRGLVAQPP